MEKNKMNTNLEKFITENKIQFSCDWVVERPDNSMNKNMDHWRCVLKANGKTFTFYYSQGYGHHHKEPVLASVLESLANDYNPSDMSFEDFCSEYGYSEDSRKAEKVYRALRKETQALDRLFGEEGMKDLGDALFNDN